MAINRVKYQPERSMRKFMELYGTGAVLRGRADRLAFAQRLRLFVLCHRIRGNQAAVDGLVTAILNHGTDTSTRRRQATGWAQLDGAYVSTRFGKYACRCLAKSHYRFNHQFELSASFVRLHCIATRVTSMNRASFRAAGEGC